MNARQAAENSYVKTSNELLNFKRDTMNADEDSVPKFLVYKTFYQMMRLTWRKRKEQVAVLENNLKNSRSAVSGTLASNFSIAFKLINRSQKPKINSMWSILCTLWNENIMRRHVKKLMYCNQNLIPSPKAIKNFRCNLIFWMRIISLILQCPIHLNSVCPKRSKKMRFLKRKIRNYEMRWVRWFFLIIHVIVAFELKAKLLMFNTQELREKWFIIYL